MIRFSKFSVVSYLRFDGFFFFLLSFHYASRLLFGVRISSNNMADKSNPGAENAVVFCCSVMYSHNTGFLIHDSMEKITMYIH